MPVTLRKKPAISKVETTAIESSSERYLKDSENKKQRMTNPQTSEVFLFQGKEYSSYSEMVDAKRERNRIMLESSGLLETVKLIRSEQNKSIKPSKRGLAAMKPKIKPTSSTAASSLRKSKRLAGVRSEDIYVEYESHGKIFVHNPSVEQPPQDPSTTKQTFFNNRVNDGSDLTLEQASLLCEEKWRTPLLPAQQFLSNELNPVATLGLRSFISHPFNGKVLDTPRIVSPQPKTPSPEITSPLRKQAHSIRADNESDVAKVTPDRIYSVAFHPSPSVLVVCAGDKQGYLGFWNVDKVSDRSLSTKSDDYDGVHLFKIHSSPISCLQWNELGNILYSISYDCTVRKFDVNSQTFSEAFATYDSSEQYKDKLGYGLDDGTKVWIQHGSLDPRQEESMFLSTSNGNVLHLDFRSGSVTFNANLSEKKINTVSLHPNGTTLATSGLDNTVRLWDVRKISASTSSRMKSFSSWQYGKSINSAFFSPSGTKLLCTTMANTIDVINEAHLQTGLCSNLDRMHRIRHDNQTGRWLTTFQAQWHPSTREDLFVVGSMNRPRRIEVFDGSSGALIRGIEGEAMTSVSSRCCFHPSQDKLIVCGGNSSGRVIICR